MAKKPSKALKGKVPIDAGTGKIVSPGELKRRPKTTVAVTKKKAGKKKH